MRRNAFHLALGLLAFVIGSFVVNNFYQNKLIKVSLENQNINAEITEQNKANNVKAVKFKCEDEVLQIIWKSLDKNYSEWKDFVVESNDYNSCQEFFDKKSIDLNNDGTDEIVVKGNRPVFCGSGGDCKNWVVSKIGNQYRIIFEAFVGEFDGDLQFLRQKNNKFKNIKIKQNNGWEADIFGIFEFDGENYQIKKCFENVNSAYDYDNIRGEKLIPVKLNDCLNY